MHRVRCVVTLLLLLTTQAARARADEKADARDLVAVGIVDYGRAIILATPGLSHRGRTWRFRSLDTSDTPQPIRDVVLAATGTKLFVQSDAGRGAVLDLTRQQRLNVPLQYVDPRDLAAGASDFSHSHRIPGQRFVSLQDGNAYVIDDVGVVQPEYPVLNAVHGAIDDEGVALYVRADGIVVICGETKSSRGECRQLSDRLEGKVLTVHARSVRMPDASVSPRFVVRTDLRDRAELVDPERMAARSAPMRRVEAAFRACLMLHGISMSATAVTTYVDALMREGSETWAADGEAVTDWRFFRAAPDADLYAPVLEFTRSETVFPAPFETLGLEAMGATAATRPARQGLVERLYDRYLRRDRSAREGQCTFYYRTHSASGSWMIEYWLYYPFDVGGFVSHPHDPEHIFVEVDKLGGAPRRFIGAGHGYLAGNNVYTADKAGAPALSLPLFAIVELGKHASAPDVDGDGKFTPGIDENEYRERAKIWGVRDVIGTINNQLIAYDNTMSTARRPEDALTPLSARTRFPGRLHPASRPRCRLLPVPADTAQTGRSLFRLSDWIIVPPCHELTADCALRHVTAHPDFLDMRTILKEWAFPEAFLRTAYGLGPRRGRHSIGLGYAMDLDRVPIVGRVLPLPGRVGAEGFYWRQGYDDPDEESCAGCSGVGWGIRYEQFLMNLFGIFSSVRVYEPPLHDAWITFGPFVEAPLGRRSNVAVAGGLAFQPYGSPRFELRISAGLWKPKTNRIGVRAGSDHRH